MKTYLLLVSLVLLLVGILGFAGVIGPTSHHSPWDGTWYFDTVENVGHTLVGLALLWVVFRGSLRLQKNFVWLSAAAGILAGLYSLLIANKILGANFQNPADTIFHLAIGVAGWITYLRHRSPEPTVRNARIMPRGNGRE